MTKLHFCERCDYNDPIEKNVKSHNVGCETRDEKKMKRQSQLRNTKKRSCYFKCGVKTTNENEHIINCERALEKFKDKIAHEADKVTIIRPKTIFIYNNKIFTYICHFLDC